MVSLAANWSTVPDKSSCTIERIGVRKYVENVLLRLSKKVCLELVYMINIYIFVLFGTLLTKLDVFCALRGIRFK